MEQAEGNNLLHPEALLAYKEGNVIRALKNCDWFTSGYIEEVIASEPMPERDGLGPFKDKLLGDFFLAGFKPDKGNETYVGVLNYVYQRMVGRQGHPFPLKNISFTDEDVLNIARRFGVDDNYEVDRGKIGEIGQMLQCLIAPEGIRRKVVRATCRWGSKRTKRDTLLWAELVKKGSKAYIKSRNL